MTSGAAAHVAGIWRHPIKGVGAEELASVDLTMGCPLPLDRALALLEAGGDSAPGWRSCRNFLRGAKGPSLMAITARIEGKRICLSHPDRPDITLPCSTEAETELVNWLHPIYPDTRPPPVALVDAPAEGMADAPFASVSLMNMSSLRAVSDKAGQQLDVRRFRGNIWLEGLAPWEEFDLIGRDVRMGHAMLHIVEPISRCRSTEANPATGKRDVPTLRILENGWGHTDFGVNATVSTSGRIARGDTVTLQ